MSVITSFFLCINPHHLSSSISHSLFFTLLFHLKTQSFLQSSSHFCSRVSRAQWTFPSEQDINKVVIFFTIYNQDDFHWLSIKRIILLYIQSQLQSSICAGTVLWRRQLGTMSQSLQWLWAIIMSWSSVTGLFDVHSMNRKRVDKANVLTEGQINASYNRQDDKWISKTAGRHAGKETDGKLEGQVANANNDTYYDHMPPMDWQ